MVELLVSVIEPRVRYDPVHVPSGALVVNVELELTNASAVPIYVRAVPPQGWTVEEATNGLIGSVDAQATVRKRIRLAASTVPNGPVELTIEAYADSGLTDKQGARTVVLTFEPIDLDVVQEFRFGVNKASTDLDGFTANIGTLTAIGTEHIVGRYWSMRHYHGLTNQAIGWHDVEVVLSRQFTVPDVPKVALFFLHAIKFNHSTAQYNASDRRTVSKFEVLLDNDVLLSATEPTATTVATNLDESVYHYFVDLTAHRGRTGVLKLRTTYRYYSAASTSDFYMYQWFGRMRVLGKP